MAEAREAVVADASAVVDLLTDAASAPAVRARLAGTELHAPAHMDAETLSALGRLQRAGTISVEAVDVGLNRLATLPLTRHRVTDMMVGAWARRENMRLVAALYAELAAHLSAPLLTLDHRLARAYPPAELLAV